MWPLCVAGTYSKPARPASQPADDHQVTVKGNRTQELSSSQLQTGKRMRRPWSRHAVRNGSVCHSPTAATTATPSAAATLVVGVGLAAGLLSLGPALALARGTEVAVVSVVCTSRGGIGQGEQGRVLGTAEQMQPAAAGGLQQTRRKPTGSRGIVLVVVVLAVVGRHARIQAGASRKLLLPAAAPLILLSLAARLQLLRLMLLHRQILQLL